MRETITKFNTNSISWRKLKSWRKKKDALTHPRVHIWLVSMHPSLPLQLGRWWVLTPGQSRNYLGRTRARSCYIKRAYSSTNHHLFLCDQLCIFPGSELSPLRKDTFSGASNFGFGPFFFGQFHFHYWQHLKEREVSLFKSSFLVNREELRKYLIGIVIINN